MLNTFRRLPWLVALVALVFYGITASPGVTLTGLPLAAKIAGWDVTPWVGQPLLWLLTLPLRLLPGAWVPFCLNLFSATTAAVTLGMLARSVELLPWPRLWSRLKGWHRRLPVLLAVAVCGLEFSFWHQATNTTGEMLEVLLPAAALWLLLEYRVRQESRWLDAAALVWGLGMAENWVMMLLLPGFVAGVIWLRGIPFFQWKFLRRMIGLGLAGFSIYALLPLANGLTPHSPWSLGKAWTASLTQTHNTFQMLYYEFGRAHRFLTLVVLIFYLIPTLACLVRLRETGTRFLAIGSWIQLWIYRLLRGGLLLACLWLALDPVTGLRQIVLKQLGVSLPLLTFDYLNALGAAFLAGNLLLIAQVAVEERQRVPGKIKQVGLAVSFATVCLVLLATGLVVRNAPAILRLNFHSLQRFGELAADSLPSERGVVVSGETEKLAVFQAALAHRANPKAWVAVDLRRLPLVAYRDQLERRQPVGWLTAENRHELNALEMLQLLVKIAGHHRLFYLNPSFGFLFEQFYLAPVGSVYEMKLRGKDFLNIPPLSRAAMDANEKFWSMAWEKELSTLVTAPSQRQSGWEKIERQLGLTPAPVFQDRLLAQWFSISLDSWGVTLQQQGRWGDARVRLEQALQLNPNNASAQISLACNTNFQSGRKLDLAAVGKVASLVGDLQRLGLVMNNAGPFDDPVFCYLLGCTFQRSDLWVQAVEQFERTRKLAPEAQAPEFALAELYPKLRLPDRAQPLINHLRDVAKKAPGNSALDLGLAMLEINSWLAQTNPANARSALTSLLQHHPDDAQIASRALLVYLSLGDFTNALQLINTKLAQTPDDVPSLNTKAVMLFQSGNAAAAIPVLDHVLALTNQPETRLTRAIVQFQCENFTAAEADYRELEKSGGPRGPVYFGLAAIATQRHDTNQAIYYLQSCLTNTLPGTALWQQASNRLQALGRRPR